MDFSNNEMLQIIGRRFDEITRSFDLPTSELERFRSALLADLAQTTELDAAFEERERLRFALHAAEIGVWDLDIETGQTERSLYHDQIFGYPEAQQSWSYRQMLQHLSPEDRLWVDRSLRRELESGGECHIECRIRRADGEYRWIAIKGRPEFDEEGKPRRVRGVILDITDRKEADAARQEAEARYRDLLEGIDAIIFEADPETWAFNFVSPQAERILGYPVERWYEKDFWINNIVHPDHQQMATDKVVREVSRGRDHEIDYRAIRADGEVIWIRDVMRLVHDDAGHVKQIRGFMLDVSAEKRAEAALRHNEERLRMAISAADLGTWDYDPHRELNWCDANFQRIFGLEKAEFSPEEAERRIHPDDIGPFQAAKAAALDPSGDGLFEQTHRIVHADGQVRWVHGQTQVLFDGPGTGRKPVRAVGVVADVTRQHEAEEALKRLNAQLIEGDRRKDEFLAMLAHELRNPLGAISNATHLLERHCAESCAQHYFAVLGRQTRVLKGLVDDLLDVSRITRGLVELKRESVEMASIARNALESVQALMDDKGHAVTVQLPAQPPRINGDPVRLEQVLVNLLGNAAKYTDPGGEICLTIATLNDEAHISVRDNGIGMTPEVRQHVFDLFGQAERGLARSEGGLGIGLTIVKTLVELHDGEVDVRSQGLNRGSEFIVRLPLAAEQSKAEPPRATRSATGNSQKSILVVDDNKDVAETLACLLEECGHRVEMAHDGPEALQKSASILPDIVLLDIGLPGMSGNEVARRMREHPATRSATLAALTGYGQARDVEEALASGFDHHFTKPVDFSVLEAFVSEGLGETMS